MKIILDDMRPLPEHDDRYRCVRTYEDCVYYLRIFKKIEFIDLDYDLGTPKGGAQFASTDCPFRMNGAGSPVETVWVLS